MTSIPVSTRLPDRSWERAGMKHNVTATKQASTNLDRPAPDIHKGYDHITRSVESGVAHGAEGRIDPQSIVPCRDGRPSRIVVLRGGWHEAKHFDNRAIQTIESRYIPESLCYL